MESIVITIGGSVILSEDIDVSFFKKLRILLKKLSKKYKIYIVAGGGKTARNYIKIGRELGFPEETLDELGIGVTRVNAKLLTEIIEISNKKIPKTTDEAKKLENPVVVMGGTTPGHSTDMVGAELAEKTRAAKLIIATNVDGIYDKDPNMYIDAKQLKEVTISQLIKQYGTEWKSAGKNIVIDGPALKIIEKTRIPTFVLNGKKLDEIEKAINGQKFNGTVIKI
ncbi:MAG: UMP kinase [Thermoplasmata archaeon]|nr:MAG: UMP kinase [Thermoplasmata archaeon]RLF36391.1 MAG: UMP kinase [Thermoplasmata archaeon]RLF53543.1 MAG: UMP kinase [Thermoplasmata archaeon]